MCLAELVCGTIPLRVALVPIWESQSPGHTENSDQHEAVMEKESDWLGKEAESIKGELKFFKKRNWEFSKKIGNHKTWN